MKFTEARAKYKAIEDLISFEQAKEIRDNFEMRLKVHGQPLADAPKLPNGMTADKDKTPAWRTAYYKCAEIRTEYRGFAEMFARRFKKEIRAERDAKYRTTVAA